MTLAQRLDELAVANAEGRLSDDEYRLLRQNLFERYGSGAIVPVEAPVVPIGGHTKHIRGDSVSSAASSQPRPQSIHVESARVSVLSSPKSRSSGVANFIRIATGKRDSLAHPAPPNNSISTPGDAASNQPKRNLVSRILSRKGSKILSVRTDIPVTQRHPSSSSKSNASPLQERGVSAANFLVPPSSRSPSRIPSPASTPCLSPSSSRHALQIDVYNDYNLITSKDIQQEIIHVETEYKNLIDAFNGLEMTILLRTQAQELRRLPVQTPTSPLALMAGQDWRDYSQVAASTSALPVSDSSDRLSIRSASSRKSSRSSLSAQLFSRGKHPPTPQRVPSPLSPLQRSPSTKKCSLSSLSSHSTSQLSSSTPSRLNIAVSTLHPGGIHGTVKPSRSAGHLPLSALPEQQALHLGDASAKDVTEDAQATPQPGSSDELVDIRKRKMEVMKRYEARLEYLRARLKSAQLHEKLLRK